MSKFVAAPPKIISSNENAYTAVTSDVALRIPCKVTGYPKPTITWRVNNSVVVTGKFLKKTIWYIIDGLI